VLRGHWTKLGRKSFFMDENCPLSVGEMIRTLRGHCGPCTQLSTQPRATDHLNLKFPPRAHQNFESPANVVGKNERGSPSPSHENRGKEEQACPAPPTLPLGRLPAPLRGAGREGCSPSRRRGRGGSKPPPLIVRGGFNPLGRTLCSLPEGRELGGGCPPKGSPPSRRRGGKGRGLGPLPALWGFGCCPPSQRRGGGASPGRLRVSLSLSLSRRGFAMLALSAHSVAAVRGKGAASSVYPTLSAR